MLHFKIVGLELTNHGPLHGKHAFRFPADGLSVFTENNESGKSTLLNAVRAVLWGATDMTKNWLCKDAPHCGAIEFVRCDADGDTCIRVERDFETHEVERWRIDADGNRQLDEQYTHNPAGRTPDNQRWPDHVLPTVWAPMSCEVFTHIAMLTQPLPAQVDSTLLQHLIVGRGSTTVAEAKKLLLARFRGVSKLSRDAGLSDRNANSDGELERLRSDRQALKARVDAASAQLESMHDLRKRLGGLDERQTLLSEQNKGIAQCQATIKDFRELNRKLNDASEHSTRFDDAATQIASEAKILSAANNRLEALPDELRELDVAALKRLELGVRRRMLEQRFTDVLGWPETGPQLVENLLKAVEGRDQLRDHVDMLSRRLADAQPQLDAWRRRLVSGAAGATLAILVAAFVIPLSNWPLGALATSFGALLGAAIVYLVYRPTKVNHEYELLGGEVATERNKLDAAERTLAGAWDPINWTDEENLNRLIELSQRRRTFLNELAALENDQPAEGDGSRQAELAIRVERLTKLAESSGANVLGQVKAAESAQQEIQGAGSRIQMVLTTLGCSNANDLEGKQKDWVDRRLKARNDLDLLIEKNAFASELAAMDGAQIETRRSKFERESTTVEQQLEGVQAERRKITRQLDRLEDRQEINVADGEMELTRIDDDIVRCRARCEAIAHAHRLLQQAADDYCAHHRESIERRVNQLLEFWTGDADRRITVDSDFNMGLIINTNAQQRSEPLSCLSQGARDQLALAVRIAALERVSGDTMLPLLVDDAFLTWDPNRRSRLREALEDIAATRQVILMTHDPHFHEWGTPIVCVSNAPSPTPV